MDTNGVPSAREKHSFIYTSPLGTWFHLFDIGIMNAILIHTNEEVMQNTTMYIT